MNYLSVQSGSALRKQDRRHTAIGYLRTPSGDARKAHSTDTGINRWQRRLTAVLPSLQFTWVSRAKTYLSEEAVTFEQEQAASTAGVVEELAGRV